MNIINSTNLRKREITPNFETRKMKTSLGETIINEAKERDGGP